MGELGLGGLEQLGLSFDVLPASAALFMARPVSVLFSVDVRAPLQLPCAYRGR